MYDEDELGLTPDGARMQPQLPVRPQAGEAKRRRVRVKVRRRKDRPAGEQAGAERIGRCLHEEEPSETTQSRSRHEGEVANEPVEPVVVRSARPDPEPLPAVSGRRRVRVKVRRGTAERVTRERIKTLEVDEAPQEPEASPEPVGHGVQTTFWSAQPSSRAYQEPEEGVAEPVVAEPVVAEPEVLETPEAPQPRATLVRDLPEVTDEPEPQSAQVWRAIRRPQASGGRPPALAPVARRHRFPVFWAFYAVMLVSLICVTGYALFYTYDSLVRYEESQPQVFMEHLIDDLRQPGKAAEDRRVQCLENTTLGAYDSPDVMNAHFDQGVGKGSYRFEEVGHDSSAPVYTVYADETPYLTLRLVSTDTYVRLGLLTITDWAVDRTLVHTPTMPEDAADRLDAGLAYDISVADSALVTVNGRSLEDDGLVEMSTVQAGFEYAAQFVDPPEAVTYHLEGLMTEPEVEAQTFDGNVIELARSGYSLADTSLSTPNREPDELPINPLEYAETWSKLMTDDLVGDLHGIDQVTAFLIPGSELYDFATTFVNSIDITFVTGHTIDSFTEEEVSNCVMYNDRLFSCDVHFVKNMTLVTGAQRPDEFSNSMIFAYVEDENVGPAGWYLVNMQALVEE